LNILHVLPTLNSVYGGPVRVVQTLKSEFEKNGHSVSIFSGDTLQKISRSKNLYWPGMHAITKLISSVESADLIHIHGLWTIPTSISARIALWKKKPYIITPHGMLDKWSMRRSKCKKLVYFNLFEKLNIDSCAGLHFLNDEEANEAHVYINKANKFIIPNGVNIDYINQYKIDFDIRSKYLDIKSKNIALFLGRLHEKKGFDLLLPALKKTIESGVDLHLLIAGPDEGNYKSEIKKMIINFGLAKDVTFAGEVHGELKFALLQQCDFFVLPSYQEGDSVALKEALAAGLPALITHACHLIDVRHQNAGLVCDLEIGQIATSLEILASDHGLRIAMSKNAVKLIETNFSNKLLIPKFEDMYRSVIEKNISF
jgi:glycosyltransferase involved in cell wall biosynthesis